MPAMVVMVTTPGSDDGIDATKTPGEPATEESTTPGVDEGNGAALVDET